MTTPHETAVHELCDLLDRIDTKYSYRCAHVNELITHAAEFAPLLAAIAGGQYVSPGSGMVVVPAELLAIVRELRTTIAPTYDMSQEGRAYLARIDNAMLAAHHTEQPVQPAPIKNDSAIFPRKPNAAMKAVIENNNCAFGSIDEFYAALVVAATATSGEAK